MKQLIAGIFFLSFCLIAQGQDIVKWKMSKLEKYTNTKNDKILVINFWATFCKPCVAEIPGFIKLAKENKESVELVLVSLDFEENYPEEISRFATAHNFDARIVWLDETNADYFMPKVSNKWSGAIPATLIVNTQTGYRHFTEGELSETELKSEIDKAAGK